MVSRFLERFLLDSSDLGGIRETRIDPSFPNKLCHGPHQFKRNYKVFWYEYENLRPGKLGIRRNSVPSNLKARILYAEDESLKSVRVSGI